MGVALEVRPALLLAATAEARVDRARPRGAAAVHRPHARRPAPVVEPPRRAGAHTGRL
jgi:hypothetical protein